MNVIEKIKSKQKIIHAVIYVRFGRENQIDEPKTKCRLKDLGGYHNEYNRKN